MPPSVRPFRRRALELVKAHGIPLATFVVFFLALFRHALFGGRFMLVGDPLKQLYPLRMVAWDMIRHGSMPMWTPYVLSGYPLFSMVMLGIGYPLTWGYLFLPGYWAEQLYILAPYALAPLFTYAFLRTIGRSAVASLLGGLVFGYGGFLLSPIGLTGVHNNSALWLPLFLLGVTLAQRRSLLSALVLTTVACTMSILGGSGQVTLYLSMLVGAYAVFLALCPETRNEEGEAGPSRGHRFRPLAVLGGAVLLSFGLTAFQTVETWTAVGLSVRRAYPLERFSEGSFPAPFAWRSLLEPLDNFLDSSTYVPALALGLAIVALFFARRMRVTWPVLFWLLAALLSWLLVLGSHTPLFKLYALLPLVKRFRYPSRHTLEWTFALGVLAAYGWDALESRFGDAGVRRSRLVTVVASGTACVLVAGVMAVQWGRAIVANGLDQITDLNNSIAGLHSPYLLWKAAFMFFIVIALWLFLQLPAGSVRTGLLALTVALSCFVEPYLWLIRPIALPWSVPVQQFSSFGKSTQALWKLLGKNERSFSVVHPYSVDIVPVRTTDGVNWPALAHIQEVNGYESLILERLAGAMRNGTGGGDAEPFIRPDAGLLDLRSRVLDLLNVRYVTSYGNFSAVPEGQTGKDGVAFSNTDLALDLASDATTSLSGGGAQADTLALVTSMAFSGDVTQGAPVAHLTVHGSDGRRVERELRAGLDTSEWAHDRADVIASIHHGLAPVFDSAPGDPAGTFQSHRYLARIALGEPFRIDRVDVTKVRGTASVGLWKASLLDSATRLSKPLPQPALQQWRRVYDQDGVTIMENLRALPRAWLVPSVGVLDTTELLRRIRGQSSESFDPRTMAFVELSAKGIQPFNGPPLGADAHTSVVSYAPCRIVLASSSRQRTMLVVSEMFYPGWVAIVDGAATPIHQTDYLLRGIVLSRGTHTIVMSYGAPGAKKGAAISLLTLVLLAIAIAWLRRNHESSRRLSS
jgi:hypothetical protein